MNSDFSGHSLEAEFTQVLEQRRSTTHSHPTSGPHAGRPHSKWLKQWGQALVAFLTGQSTLSISQRTSPNGTTHWQVYDPSTDNLRRFDSEQAVRVWLEQRLSCPNRRQF